MNSSPVKKMDRANAEEPSLPPASTSSTSSIAGMKRPAPSLLPPFEPLSSSPGFPRPLKRQARDRPINSSAFLKYPTPVPTSSTGILSSSPPRVQPSRPGLQRTQSSVSERAPLSAVPSVELNENGEMLLMGRSSSSAHHVLSTNHLVSRVHVKARYIPSLDPFQPNKVEIICNGWNGIKLHCQGRTWELSKGDTFTSETETEIMVDVQDARVMVRWPKRERRDSIANLSDSSWDESPRSRSRRNGSVDFLQSSPLRREARIRSPESPSPATRNLSNNVNLLLDDDLSEPVQIYEDASGDEQELPAPAADVDVSFAQTEITNSFSSDLSDPGDDDLDEENDPIVHSFGPFGANLSNRLAAFTAESPKQSPKQSRSGLSGDTTAKPSAEPEETISSNVDVAAVRNHVVNQLAFSRLSSTPLSAIMNNLPAEEKKDLTKPALNQIIAETSCIGVIARQGKDAAGKPLESEYYYIPEHDNDESRRVAVTDGLRKPSLRACRKQHKQYYWKRPKTP
ncbi:hypothetical protein F4781DRAFT_388412 [Annulohypoxylon bovei var. microspora]|nr:hypothetical protein F4781DRAFT_388412 [Annulohypoxylon bovei var. microspora]